MSQLQCTSKSSCFVSKIVPGNHEYVLSISVPWYDGFAQIPNLKSGTIQSIYFHLSNFPCHFRGTRVAVKRINLQQVGLNMLTSSCL